MSLINESVIIEEFFTWAKENENKDVFPVISKAESSYFSNRVSEETYMIEYSFNTLAELKEGLKKYSNLSVYPQMLKKVTVETCKNRFMHKLNVQENDIQKEVKKQKMKKELPDYIYTY